ncbi:ArsR/SmtB family transcription factor [Halomarina halobia]|uniref:ArsR/SmtB family transcription factor n=1 Tax=Halomarina halobia TaxID=3033386 RepID=A0ABD6A8P0_9EURY|nr:winged helix-turn-helix domain-containing protein [Halomarina sp. PSR21]
MSLFDVLGSKARLQILQEVSSGPRYVSELAERVGMDGKTAVHHLAVLEEAGLVTSYRAGRRKYYRLVKAVELRAEPRPDRTFVLHARETGRRDDAEHGDAEYGFSVNDDA